MNIYIYIYQPSVMFDEQVSQPARRIPARPLDTGGGAARLCGKGRYSNLRATGHP